MNQSVDVFSHFMVGIPSNDSSPVPRCFQSYCHLTRLARLQQTRAIVKYHVTRHQSLCFTSDFHDIILFRVFDDLFIPLVYSPFLDQCLDFVLDA